MADIKKLGVVSVDILNESYSILDELYELNGIYSHYLKRDKRTRKRMETEAMIHSAEMEFDSKNKKHFLDEDIYKLNLAYTFGKKNFKGKLNKDLLSNLLDIIELYPYVSTTANREPHKFRVDGDKVYLYDENGKKYPFNPPVKDISLRLDDYIKFSNDGSFNNLNETLTYFRKHNTIKRNSKITDLEKSLLTHFHIATIHPFFDGNGRVARLSQSIMLENEGFTPGYIPTGEKIFYCNILADAQIAYNKRSETYFKKLREEGIVPNHMIERNYCNISKKEHLFFDYLASKVLIGLKSLKKESLRQ